MSAFVCPWVTRRCVFVCVYKSALRISVACVVYLCAFGCQHLCVDRWAMRTPSPGETSLAGSSASPQWQSRPPGQGG